MIPTGRSLLAAAAAIAAGLAIVLSQPPVSFAPLSFLAPALLLAAVAIQDRAQPSRPPGRRRRPRVVWLGVLAGLTAYLPMLTWIVAPAGYLAWTLLGVIQAGYLGAVAWLVRPVVHRPVVVLVAPVVWTGHDTIRALFPLGGFEWGALGYAHVDGSWLLPLARIAGLHAVTFATVLIGALVYEVVRVAMSTTDGLAGDRLQRLRAGLPSAQPAFLGLAGVLLVSALATIEPPAATGDTLDVLTVQGNDLAAEAFVGREQDRVIAANLVALTRRSVAAEGAPDLTVWPESSIDRDPTTERGADLLPFLRDGGAAADGNLLAGAVLDGPDPATTRYTTNLLVDAEGRIADRYDKRLPVPFGEYVPFRSALDWFPPLRQIPRDTLRGEGPHAFDVDGHRVTSIICFETLFPQLVRSNVLADGEEAGLIVATTTDASFGFSAEPEQHLAQSRMRAVETGRWVVHAAQSGSSAFVDPDGGVHQATGLFTAEAIRMDVPLVAGRTPFLTIGDVVGQAARALTLLLAVAVAVDAIRRRRATSEGADPDELRVEDR